MNESHVTLQGWVGNDVELRETTSGAVVNFRLGCTPRFFRNNEWHEGQTSWFTVTAWRGLARNVAESVRKGDPVVVQGRIRVENWVPNGEQQARTTWIVDATVIGHDMNKGTSKFARPMRSVVAPAGVDPSTGEITAAIAAEPAEAEREVREESAA